MDPDFTFGGYFPRTLSEHPQALGSPPEFHSESYDRYWMKLALMEAMKGVGWSAPNPSVGAILVQDGKEIARGFTQAYRHQHAERMLWESIQDSVKSALKDATLYVTLEPCVHHGNQPPCLDLIQPKFFSKVVIGCKDPFPQVSGASIKKLTQLGLQVRVGVLEEECTAWHFPFLRFQQKQRTVWIAKWAQSVDGYLANDEGESKWISGEDSRKYTHWLRQKYDAILVGAGTWNRDHPALTVRNCAKPHRRNPARVLLDPFAKASVDFIHQDSELFVLTAKNKIQNWLDLGLKKQNLKEIDGDPRSWVDQVNQLGFQSIMVEGGAFTLKEFFKLDVFDLAHVFVGDLHWGNPQKRHMAPIMDSAKMELKISKKIQTDDLHEWVKKH